MKPNNQHNQPFTITMRQVDLSPAERALRLSQAFDPLLNTPETAVPSCPTNQGASEHGRKPSTTSKAT